MVSGSKIYKVKVSIGDVGEGPLEERFAPTVRAGSTLLVELLQGRFSKGVMERICRQDNGLFPAPIGNPVHLQLPGLCVDVQAHRSGALWRRRAAR